MRKVFILLAAFILISNTGIAQSQMKTWSPEGLEAYIALSNRAEEEVFRVQGYVVKLNDCYCPPQAQCKPCSPNFFLLKEYKELADGEYPLSGLRVNYNLPIKIEESGKYTLLVKVPAKVNNPVELQEIVE